MDVYVNLIFFPYPFFEVFVNLKALRLFPVVKEAEIFYLQFMADPVGAENNHKVWIKFKLKQC